MRIYFCVFLFSLSTWLGAQIQFPKTPTTFIAEFKTQVLKIASDSQKVQLQNFETLWASGQLTPFQKKTTMQSMQALADKKQGTAVMWKTAHLLMIAKNKNVSEKQIDTLVQIFKYSFENDQAKESHFLLRTLESYLQNNILYQDNLVTVTALGNAWDFSLVQNTANAYEGGYDFGTTEKNDFESFEAWDAKPGEEVDWDSYDDNTPTNASASEETEFVVYAEEMPALAGGLLKFKTQDLQIITPLDTLVIKNTSGTLSLSTGEFVGAEGTFDWTSVGLDPSVYCKFKSYHFNVKKPELLAEDVIMHYPEKVTGGISGIFEFNYQARKIGTLSTFPRFMSYQNKVEIKGLGDNIEYMGGFAMNGSKVFSSCVQGTPSTIKVKHDGVLKFKATAPYFELNDSIIDAKPSRVTFYLGRNDSITHPGVRLKYNSSNQKIFARKDVTAYKNSPFTNTYHQLEMDIDQIDWLISDTVMTMQMIGAKQEVPAIFSSIYKYSETEYVHLKGIYPFHPLVVIMNYCNKNKTDEFSSTNIADAIKQKQHTIEGSLKALQEKGFVTFNSKNSMYSLTEKAKHYYLSRLEKEDYDIISVKSLAVTKPEDPSAEPFMSLPYNASLNLNSNKLTVDGVESVVLSDSNDVRFVPSDRKVIFMKNRNMLFNGTVTTSNYVFNGRDFEFNYDLFNLKLENIDSIEFAIEVYDSVSGTMKREKMDNKLSYSKGTLTIDEADNKSGLKSNPRYPHFDANHGASVLFNKPDILNGVYDSTFRYLIPPFAVDSLSGDMESNVSFDGEFVSGGVFPSIHQKLEVMPDKGFGFIHEAPKEGYPIYDGLAHFFGTVTLNKNGLRGEGKIVFLNTTLESMDFVFYKDSVKGLGDIAVTKSGTNPKTGSGITFPACTVTDYEMAWYPSKDSMHITNYDNAFKLFNDQVDLSGALIITHQGMKGTGLVETNGSLTISKNFLFKEKSFSATKGQFEILTNVVGKPALQSDYVNVDMDMEKKQAWFSPAEEGYASNNFPYLKYRTSLNDGFWDIQKKLVTMEKPYEMDINDSYFYSTKKSQDSLVFNAEKAYYFIDSLKLKIEGVEMIRVADAMVYPANRKIEIKENAEIVTLKNAIIVMDTVNEYHTLIDGEININSRSDLDGHASYQYINFEEDTIPIKFSDFKFEALKNEKGIIEYHTVARGTVLEEDTFMVAPQMLFKGEVSMFAHRRLLSIDGYIKLDLHGSVASTKWMRYENKSESDGIKIDLESQENKENLNLTTGTFYSATNNDYYSVFIGDLQDETDQAFFKSNGYLTHDIEKREFEVVNKDRLDNKAFAGNLFGYIEQEEYYDLQGKFELINPTPAQAHHYLFAMAGNGKDDISTKELSIKGLTSIKFEVPAQVNDVIAAKFLDMQKYFPPVKTIRSSDTLYHAVGDIAGAKEALKFKEASAKNYAELSKTVKFFSDGITLNDLTLAWNRETKSWHSVGAIGLVSVGSQDLNMFAKAFLEIIKTPEEDQINFYLEANPSLWYYFTYADNSLKIATSDGDLDTYVRTKNTESKNMSRGLYYWTSAEEDDLTRFKQHFIQDYLAGKDFEIDYAGLPKQQRADERDNEFDVPNPEKTPVKDEFEEEFEEKTNVTEMDAFEVEKDSANSPKGDTSKVLHEGDEFEEKQEVDTEVRSYKTDKKTKNKNNKKTEENKPLNIEKQEDTEPKDEFEELDETNGN